MTEKVEDRLAGRIVKVWAVVENQNGEKATIRMVRDARKGIAFVQALRKLGFRCGWDWRFRGERMATKAQVRMLFAVAKQAGYVEPK